MNPTFKPLRAKKYVLYSNLKLSFLDEGRKLLTEWVKARNLSVSLGIHYTGQLA